MNSLGQLFQNFKNNSLFIYCVQIFIVLSGTTLGLFFLNYEQWIVPVTLGAIAAALTDFDDRLVMRLRNLLYVCILFFVVSSILEFLFPYKLLFILYLSLNSAALILLGGLGQRYATISFGAVLLSIYTMFGLGEHHVWYIQPLCFVVGAIWYGISSIIFYLIKPTQAVQDNLCQSFIAIADLLRSKAQLFDPDHRDQVEALLYAMSLKNATVVQNLNQTKASLLTRLKAARANHKMIHWLNLYFFAQDIHEQASSNYLHYEQIQQNFSRTDVIYRIQKNIRLLACACEDLAQSILQNKSFEVQHELTAPLENLTLSMQDWIRQNPDNLEVKNLQLILNNLKSLYTELHSFQKNSPPVQNRYQQHIDNLNLLDDDIQGWHDLWLKLKQHLTPQSALFRHAVRIAFVFALGYVISLLPFARNGYWILLTSLFVCQVSYFATKSRLIMRTVGTLLGVLIGVPVLYFIPSIEGQLLLTIICGVYFFYLRSKKYAIATLMATLMVLLIFNLKGAGYSIIFPRIIDTLLGCLIAWFAVSVIWPDWNFRNISRTINKSSMATMTYFSAVVQQHQSGKNNSMAYRKARRAAHNAQTELSSMISSLSTEPHPDQHLVHNAFRYLVYSHSQLSYISALGSHRQQVTDTKILQLLLWTEQTLNQAMLDERHLSEREIFHQLQEIQQLNSQQQLSEHWQLVLKQISLLLETLPELLRLKQQLLAIEIK
ncbi:TIGR01666 family membrane protein [Acinetobacter qingfengensis]|uniref:TIGR01666 family membrane protein n=1 Tax=Acinetobacter qingfengensis TaxID=1262585 RepID=A0A1E7QXK1_9GAMM|nr:YccS family putative transporter [Acinetobacter qingfengensis]KAA8731676.1 TIGR01666 family membrane protein [Acinetobacter qingfengensis]OEY91779.1 TIGR01666 family membrane protein [Acinetobacter qingfengensis]